MRIKDIARLSGVSVSTVSKIMNNKADSIAEQTKLKVLQIAKEYHYTPYSSVKRNPGTRHYLLGLVAPLEKRNVDLIRGLEAAAGRAGYKVVISNPGGEAAETEKHLRILSDTTDGVLLLDRDLDGAIRQWLTDNKVPAVAIDADSGDWPQLRSLAADWRKAGQLAVEYLEGFGHRRIGVLSPDKEGWKSSQIKLSMERYYSEQEMVFDHKLAVTPESLPTLLQIGATALICTDMDMAALFYKFAWEHDLMIPHEVSVIALTDGPNEMFLPPLTTVKMDFQALADNSVEALAALIEDRKAAPLTSELPSILAAESVTRPENTPGTASHILVVGTLNLDVVMNVPLMPSSGDTVLIDSLTSLPGGKGANQAIGVAKLGGEVSLVGRIGRDAGGRILYNTLRAGGVNTKGISVDRQVETGKAYINVNPHGDSFIEVYNGANQRLEKRHLERNEMLFRSSRYCLIQSELPRHIYTQAVDFAHRNGSRVIFKPCSIDTIAAEVLEKIHLLVPNQKEAARLAGMDKNIEEQADYFLEQGVDGVIITLAEQGCFHRTRETSKWYAAYEELGLIPVDTSGASDAFISALALSLAEGHVIDTAIRYAQVAAGLSICQKGVQSSMPDRTMMELRKTYYMPK
ncbi:hypothetical protein C4J81_03185 [Deltaproteobacteria bacterium Smac51]|nr:hypothetical protein C4J81_03185 [Deltaproteobacteria bacterium Smac51]